MKKSFNPLMAPEGDFSGQGGGGTGLMGAAVAVTHASSNPAPPSAPASQPPSPILGEDGKFSPQWYKGNPELEPYSKQLDKFADPAGLAKSYAHLEKNRAVPSEGADAGAIEAFRKANNIPDTHDGYDLKFPDKMPDGIVIDDNAMAKYKELFHQLNITPLQAVKLAEGHINLTAEILKNHKETHEDTVAQALGNLRKEWGTKFDGNLATARRTFEMLCVKSGVNGEEVSFLNDPKFAKLMASVSKLMAESDVVGIGNSSISKMRSNQEEADDIVNNSNHPDYKALYTPSDPRHAEILDRVARMSR